MVAKIVKIISVSVQTIFVLLLSISFLLAGNLDELFKEANDAYRAEKYQDAISLYKNILSQGYDHSELYYNLGNCYFRLNQIGQAMLYYEKARKLNPNDADLKYNLELAGLKVVDRVELPPRFFLFTWWDTLKDYFSLNKLAILIILLFNFSILCLIIRMFLKSGKFRTLLVSLTSVTGLLFVLFAYIFILRVNDFRNKPEGIILSPSVTVLSAPDENSTDVFILHEGVKVALEEQRDSWVKISLVDGKTGWIKYKVLGII